MKLFLATLFIVSAASATLEVTPTAGGTVTVEEWGGVPDPSVQAVSTPVGSDSTKAEVVKPKPKLHKEPKLMKLKKWNLQNSEGVSLDSTTKGVGDTTTVKQDK